MRDVYISVEALRNSADLLHSRMNTWLVSKIAFHPARGEDWVGRQRTVLTALGVEADLAELLATELELCLEGDKLWVKEGAKVAIVANTYFYSVYISFFEIGAEQSTPPTKHVCTRSASRTLSRHWLRL
jgi:hypothetical protein